VNEYETYQDPQGLWHLKVCGRLDEGLKPQAYEKGIIMSALLKYPV
jgi:hypothetical protein